MIQDPRDVIFLQQFLLEIGQQGETHPVKEGPVEPQKKVEKVWPDVHRDQGGEKAKDPIRSIHLDHDVVFLEMLKELRLLFFQQMLNHIAMLIEAWKLVLIDVTELIVLNYADENPEGNFFIAVIEKAGNDKIHPLDVADALIIVRICKENSL
jgi:hypothetical protein